MALIKNMLTIAGVGLIVAVATFMLDVYQVYDERNQKVSGRYTEIIVDTSLNMREKFPGTNKTKWNSVSNVMQNVLQNQHKTDNISIRVFGGECNKNDTNTKLLTEFGKSNFSEMIYELSKVRPRGKASLKSAIINATADFSELEHLNTVTRRIILIIGSNEFCTDHSDYLAKELKKRLGEMYKVESVLIGYKLGVGAKDYLAQLKSIVFDDVVFADTEGDLSHQLESIVNVRADIAAKQEDEANGFTKKNRHNKGADDYLSKFGDIIPSGEFSTYSESNYYRKQKDVVGIDNYSAVVSEKKEKYITGEKKRLSRKVFFETKFVHASDEVPKYEKDCPLSSSLRQGAIPLKVNYVESNVTIFNFNVGDCFVIQSINNELIEIIASPAELNIDNNSLKRRESIPTQSQYEHHYFGVGTYKEDIRVEIEAIVFTDEKYVASVKSLESVYFIVENHSVKSILFLEKVGY